MQIKDILMVKYCYLHTIKWILSSKYYWVDVNWKKTTLVKKDTNMVKT